MIKKQIGTIILSFLLILAVAGCSSDENNKTESNTSTAQTSDPSIPKLSTNEVHPPHLIRLYDTSQFSIIWNELIDTYYIACGMFFGFESDFLFNSDMRVDYQQTIEHFTPYRNHSFVQGLGRYLDIQNKYADMEVLYYLSQYIISVSNTGLGIGNIQSNIFQSDDEFYSFIVALYEFYQETDANVFFGSSNIHNDKRQYLLEYAKDVPIDDLINEMENYVGNKSVMYGSNNIYYYSMVSVYKSPNNASFRIFGMNNDIFMTSIQSPLGFDGDFSIAQLFETAQHEALHMYINSGIEVHSQLIQDLSKDKNPLDFTSGFYVYMPWHRIVDEAVVRVVQARIYGIVYDDLTFAYQQILSKEDQFGFQNIDGICHILEEYELNRAKYPTIDDYSTVLIERYLSNSP